MSKIQPETSTQGRKQQRLLEVLTETQERLGYLSGNSLVEIAESLDVALSEVYGVATFYSFLATRPRGRHVIRICKSVPCLLKDARSLVDSIGQELGVKLGETTADGRFTFELTNCIGACDKGPAMMIDHDVHDDLTPEKISRILADYR